MATKATIKADIIVQPSTVFRTKNIFGFIFGLTLLLYGNTLFNQYNLDDELVTRKHKLTSLGFSAIPEIFTSPYYSDDMGYSYEYRPMVLVSFAIEHAFFGESPTVSHMVNLLIYALTSVLFFFIAQKMVSGNKVLFSVFATILFIVHPIHTEAVSGIKNRDELLSLAGGLLAFLFYIKYSENKGWYHVLTGTFFLFAALLSKLSALSFTIIIPLYFIIKNIELKKTIVVALIASGFLTALLVIREYHAERITTIVSLIMAFIGFVYFLVNQNAAISLDFINNLKPSCPVLAVSSSFNRADLFVLLPVILLSAYSVFGGLYLYLVPAVMLLLFIPYVKKNYNIFYLLLAVLVTSYFGSFHFAKHIQWMLLFYVIALSNVLFSDIKNRLFIQVAAFAVTIAGSIFRDSDNATSLSDLVLPAIYMVTELLSARFNFNRRNKLIFWSSVVLILVIGAPLVSGKLKTAMLIIPLLAVLGEIVPSRNRFFLGLLISISVLFSVAVLNLPSPFKEFNFAASVENAANKMTDEVPVSVVNATATEPLVEARPLDFIEFPLGLRPTPSKKAGTAVTVLGKYLSLMMVPVNMSYYYGYNVVSVDEITSPAALFWLAVHLSLFFAALWLLKKHAVASFGVFAYLVSIFLFSTYIYPIAGTIGDRFTYVASFGFCIAAGYAVFRAYVYCSEKNKKFVMGVFVGLMVIYSGMTIARNVQWKNHLTLMRHDIQHLDKSAQAHNILASNLMKYSFEKEYASEMVNMRKEAVIHYKKAIEIYPDFFNAWYDLGRTYLLLNDVNNAYPCFMKVHEMDSTLSDATLNIAMIAESKNDFDTAVKYYIKLIRINPDVKQGYNSLSYLYFRMNRPELSIEVSKAAIQFNPNWKEPYENISRVYMSIKDTTSANYYYNESLKH